MENTDETDPVWPGFAWRLRSALERVEPPIIVPRYGALRGPRPSRLTRIALALAIAGIAGLTTVAATGSTNPSVWRQRIVTTLQSSPEATPTSESREGGSSGAAGPRHAATPQRSAEPEHSPGPSDSPEPHPGGE
jgi:hypothetical protein